MFSAHTNVNKAVVLQRDFPQWFCLFSCLAQQMHVSEKPQQRASKCIKEHRGGGGVDTQGVSAAGVGRAAEGYDKFCMFITSAHLGKFGLLRSGDSFRPI